MTADLSAIISLYKGTMAETLGIRLVDASPDRVVATIEVRPELTTVGGAVHGGTLMAFADTLGATGAFLNLPPAAATTTLESKTNFFAAGKGGVIRGESLPLHKGRRTSVWQTRVTDEKERLLSLTIQTQLVVDAS
jgi:1,4-dihydroxy-2-naphthoyl-CoA hydrolase